MPDGRCDVFTKKTLYCNKVVHKIVTKLSQACFGEKSDRVHKNIYRVKHYITICNTSATDLTYALVSTQVQLILERRDRSLNMKKSPPTFAFSQSTSVLPVIYIYINILQQCLWRLTFYWYRLHLETPEQLGASY